MISFDHTVDVHQGPTAVLMREMIAGNPSTDKVTGPSNTGKASALPKKVPWWVLFTNKQNVYLTLCIRVHKRFSLWETAQDFTSGRVIQVRCL